MKRLSKGLRSISPFNRRGGSDTDPVDRAAANSSTKMNTDELLAPSDEDNNSDSNRTMEKYSLNGVSFKDFLIHFYTKFNPEKIGMIDYIAQEYEGDELIMISNLAEKYQLSHAEMQRLIDASKRTIRQQQARAALSDTDSEPESEPNSEPTVSELSTGSLRQGGYGPYNGTQPRGRKGVSFSGSNSVRTYDRDASPLRSDGGRRNTSPSPASLQDIIKRNRPQDQSPKSNMANRSLLGNSLLSPAQQPGARKPSPRLRSSSPTVGNGTGPQPHPARSSSPLQNIVNSQNQNQNQNDPAMQQRLLNQKNQREQMLQNQQEEMMTQQRQQMLAQQHQQHQMQLQQQEEQQQQKSLQEVVREDEEFLANQVRAHSQVDQQEPLPDSTDDGARRTQTVHIEEIKLELARTQQALTEADRERDEVLRLLEEMAAAPMQMKSVVEAYLDNRSRGNSAQHSRDVSVCSDNQSSPPYQSQYQRQLQQVQERGRHGGSGDSVVSNTSNSLRGPRDLEGQNYNSRSFSPSMRSGSATKAKSYMLGTASSSKRETSNAAHGGKTGAFNIHANGNGRHPSPMFDRPSSSASVRSSSTGGQQFGQRYIRPSSATRTGNRVRSSSATSSENSAMRGRGAHVRSSSPASSITSADVERQYASTKQRINRDTQQAMSNQQASQRRIEKTAQDAAMERQRALAKRVDSPGRQKDINSDSVTDWVVCVDPKSQKNYYYSRSLGKSTWTAPPQLATAASTPSSVNGGGPPSRSGSATSKSRGVVNWRSSSPGGTSATRSASPSGSTASSRGGGGSAIWKSAKDPKSGRMYWFNRKTRESTWKNPFEVS